MVSLLSNAPASPPFFVSKSNGPKCKVETRNGHLHHDQRVSAFTRQVSPAHSMPSIQLSPLTGQAYVRGAQGLCEASWVSACLLRQWPSFSAPLVEREKAPIVTISTFASRPGCSCYLPELGYCLIWLILPRIDAWLVRDRQRCGRACRGRLMFISKSSCTSCRRRTRISHARFEANKCFGVILYPVPVREMTCSNQ